MFVAEAGSGKVKAVNFSCTARCRIHQRLCRCPAVSQQVTHRSKVLVLVLGLNFVAGGNQEFTKTAECLLW